MTFSVTAFMSISSPSKQKTPKIHPSQAWVITEKSHYGCRGYHSHVTSSLMQDQGPFPTLFNTPLTMETLAKAEKENTTPQPLQ